MTIRILIREHLLRQYQVLWANERFRSWLSIWFDNERTPMDLFEFYYLMMELPGADLLIYETVKVNSYNPGKTFTENLKEVEDLMNFYKQEFQSFLDEENEGVSPYEQITMDSFSDEEIKEMVSEGKTPSTEDIEKSKQKIKDWIDSLGK